MQWKLPPPSRFADRVHRWMLSRGFPVLLKIAVVWPRWLLLLGSRAVIFVVMVVYPRPKASIDGNLARILGMSTRSGRVRAARRRMLRHFGYYWLDLFRFAQLPSEAGREHLAVVQGLERVDELLEEGSGVILLTAHLGNWELGSVFLGQDERPVSVVYVEDRYPEAESFRSRLRTRGNVEEIPLEVGSGWGSLPVLRRLRENRIVAMQGDRDFDGRGIPAEFFGEDVRFPRGPFIVSLLTGAPIVPTFLTYTPDLEFRAEFRSPIRAIRTGDRESDLKRAVDAWAETLEEVVATYPDQWYTFFDYWEEYGTGERPETERDAG
ncbi:MAG: lysophospholipid acyltransferase family protein [Thermoanaerobaculia bacterium]|nr:lysophospholipid acyltransferase family protein [Thermoanaerobaculia bacterium]